MRVLLVLCLLPTVAFGASFKRLHADRATASSFLRSTWNKYEENYHPNYVLDDDPKTAWVEGADGDGLGEALSIPVSPLRSARAVKLVVFNGYQKSPALLAANAAPRVLEVKVLGPGGRVSATAQWTLERTLGGQALELPVTAGVDTVVLTVKAVHPGSKYKDTCISDVQVFVDSEVPYLASIESGKRKALLAWRAERLQAAKYFASLPKTYPFAGSAFGLASEEKTLVQAQSAQGYLPLEQRLSRDQLPSQLSDDEARALRLLLRVMKDGPAAAAVPLTAVEGGVPQPLRWYAVSSKRPRRLPDDFPLAVVYEPLVTLGESTLFEAPGPGKPVAVARSGKETVTDFREGWALGHLALLEGSAAAPTLASFTVQHRTVERTAETENIHVLARFAEGRLTSLATVVKREVEHIQGPEDEPNTQELEVTFTQLDWVDGKVTQVTRRTLTADGYWDVREEGLHLFTQVFRPV